ncbi:MAG TPA: ATP synthase F1 subunit epsilon [Candidatus Faecaligallichristensenella faecipullorum]|nr:ATP synthase F1 subunit epsilon [Candidatus Faecaligallichristensenella faecipullorum]
MAKNFKLSIITPERLFFEGEVEMLVVESTDGQLAIMAGHEQGVIAIESGEIRIKQNGEYKDAAISSGMVTVAHDETLVMVQTVEWPEEIDIRRAENDRMRAQEMLRQKNSLREYHLARTSLARAMARLRVSKSHNINHK